jgi:gluconolactonase
MTGSAFLDTLFGSRHHMTFRSIMTVLGCLAIPAAMQGQGQGPAQQGQPLGGPAGAVREVTVTAIPAVVAAGARWTLAWQGTDNADGIVGTDDGGLLFAQEQPNRVSKLDPNDKVSVFVQNTRGAGSVSFDARGRLVAAQRTCTDPGRREPCPEPPAIGVIYPEGERRILAERVEGQSIGRPNDLVASRQGTVYFTSGGAFSVNPAGTVSSIGTGLRTNGIMLSPDEKILYITNGPVVVAFDVQPDGTVRNQRDFAKLEGGGAGDGMAIDAGGRLYVTSQPGVQVFSADGKYLGLIPTPRAVASVAFSGPGKRTLYVTGAGALGPDGTEISTPPGVRNNAKSIFKIPMLAQGFTGRPK